MHKTEQFLEVSKTVLYSLTHMVAIDLLEYSWHGD